MSPSTRRAWIEIPTPAPFGPRYEVALHPEGVDRNIIYNLVGFKLRGSPSTRRAWIEIFYKKIFIYLLTSPSTRRAWIEISGSILDVYGGEVALHPEGVD